MGVGSILLYIIVAVVLAIAYIAYKAYKSLTSLVEVGTPLICPTDKDTIGALCYDKCPDGYTNDGTGICYKNDPAGWEGTSSLTHLQKASEKSQLGQNICEAGMTERGALCPIVQLVIHQTGRICVIKIAPQDGTEHHHWHIVRRKVIIPHIQFRMRVQMDMKSGVGYVIKNALLEVIEPHRVPAISEL
jgi:hypothetical protein